MLVLSAVKSINNAHHAGSALAGCCRKATKCYSGEQNDEEYTSNLSGLDSSPAKAGFGMTLLYFFLNSATVRSGGEPPDCAGKSARANGKNFRWGK